MGMVPFIPSVTYKGKSLNRIIKHLYIQNDHGNIIVMSTRVRYILYYIHVHTIWFNQQKQSRYILLYKTAIFEGLLQISFECHHGLVYPCVMSLLQLITDNTMKNHTVGTILKSNRKSYRKAKSIPCHIHNHNLITSFTAYNQMCNKSNKTGVFSRAVCVTLPLVLCVVIFVLFLLAIVLSICGL